MGLKQLQMSFWDDQQDKLQKLLEPLIRAAALKSAQNSLAILVDQGIGVDWALINTAVVNWSRTYTYDLVSKINGTTRKFVMEAISNWERSGLPLPELVNVLSPMFGPIRAEMIAVTEVTRAFAEGNLATWRASGLVKGKKWQTAADDKVCPICQPLQGQTSDLDGNFEGGQMSPPAHVRCRCWLQPVLDLP